jgi:flagellar biosynthesis/type III secretory pathway chaperone
VSIEAINKSLEELTIIHEELLKVSERKTEIVKDGSIDKFQSILAEERKYVNKLEQAEKNRQIEVETWYKDRQLLENDMTITNILETITDEQEQEELAKQTTDLTNAIAKLKQQEHLNQALIQQSMQFVQLSLDMLSPTIKNMNYGQSLEVEGSKRSVFDSKA